MRWHLKGFKTWSSLKWRSVSFESTRLWILFFWDESQADWKSKSPSPWKVLNDVSKSTYTAHCACYWVLSQTCAHISSKEIRKHTVFIFMKIIILSKGYIDIRMYLMNTLRYVCVCAFVFVYLRHLVWFHITTNPFIWVLRCRSGSHSNRRLLVAHCSVVSWSCLQGWEIPVQTVGSQVILILAFNYF